MGRRLMSWSEVRETYGRELVNLRNEGRYTFLNTLFSVSEAVLYMQVGPLTSEASDNMKLHVNHKLIQPGRGLMVALCECKVCIQASS